MHIAYKIWRNTIYSAHVVDASIERRRNTSYAIHFYKLYNVSEKWNYGVARRVESYETPSFYFIFKRILLTNVNQPMRCGAFGFYLLIFVEFVHQMVPTELADLWLSRWNLFYRLLFFFFTFINYSNCIITVTEFSWIFIQFVAHSFIYFAQRCQLHLSCSRPLSPSFYGTRRAMMSGCIEKWV